MEQLIYLTVKVLSAAYILYNAYRFLSGKRAAEFWRLILPEIRVKEKSTLPVTKQAPEPRCVVGKSRTVYLEEPPREKPAVPAFSEELEKGKPYGEEPDITAGDVEDNLDEEIPPEEERFIPLDTEPDGGAVSTGMTYEQISEALDVVQGKKTGEAARSAAARILHEAGGDLFNFLSAQAENEAVIERLLKENLDNDGVPPPENSRKHRKEITEFDMDRYV